MLSRTRVALLFVCLVSLLSQFSHSNEMLMEPYFGNESSTLFDANIVAISEEAGYSIFSSFSKNIPGYNGPETPAYTEMTYIKNITSGEVTLLSQTEQGQFLSNLKGGSFSEISVNNTVFFYYNGEQPLKGTEYDGDWNELSTRLFRLNLNSKKITAISTPFPHSFTSQHLITNNEFIYFIDTSNHTILLSRDLGENWSTLDITCSRGINFHDFTQEGAVLFTCKSQDDRIATYYDPESESITQFPDIPPFASTDNHFNYVGVPYYYNDGVEMSSDGKFIAYTVDDVIVKLNRETNEIQQFPIKSMGITSPQIYAANLSSNFVLFSGKITNNIYFERDLTSVWQRFNTATEAWFYMELSSGALPKKVNLLKHDNETLHPYLTRIFTSDSSTSTFFQIPEIEPLYRRFLLRLGNEQMAKKTFTSKFSKFELTVTKEGAHQNLVTIEHDLPKDVLFKIQRKSHKYDVADTFWFISPFWSDDTEYTDYALSLRTGENTYTATPCDINLVCAKNTSSTYEIETLDYSKNQDWTLTLQPPSNDTSSLFEGEIKNLNWPNSSGVKVSLINDKDRFGKQSRDFSIRFDRDIENLVVGLQPCTKSRLQGSSSICSEVASLKNLFIPRKPEIQLLMAHDFSYVAVYFEQQENITYSIERRTSGSDFSKIADNVTSGWQDSDVTIGSSYEYRVLACKVQQSFCHKSDITNLTIDRKSTLQISIDSIETRSATFLINNNIDADEIRIFHSNTPDEFELVSTVPVQTKTYHATNLIPGAPNYYQIQTLLNDKIIEQFNTSFKTQKASKITPTIETEITNLTIDTSYALTHVLTWDSISDVVAWRVEVLSSGNTVNETLLASDEPRFVFNYQDYISDKEVMEYKITPLYVQCLNDSINCEEETGTSAKIFGNLMITNISSKQLYPPQFTASQASLNGITLDIHPDYLHENYKVERKAENEENWNQIDSFTTDNVQDKIELIDDSSNLLPQVTYQYRVKTCSAILDKCATSDVQSLRFKDEHYSGNAFTPSISFNNELINVNFNFDSPQFVAFAELVGTWRNRNESWHITDPSKEFIVPRRISMFYGYVVNFKVRYCFHRPEWPYNEIEDCTEFSELVSVEIAEDETESKPSIVSFYGSPDEEKNTLNLNIRFYNGASSGKPDTIEIFRATNDAPHETIAHFELRDEDYPDLYYSDSDIELDTYYNYGIEACNQIGCHQAVSLAIKHSQKTAVALPEKPVITHISNGEFADKIFVRYQNNDQTSNFTTYRAESPEGEFHRIYAPTSSLNIQDNRTIPGKSYFYRIDACNNIGCTSSDIVEGKTRSLYFTQTIDLSDLDLRDKNNVYSDLVNLEGNSKAIDGKLDAFSGNLYFNQWLNLSKGWQINTTARLDTYDAECSKLLNFNLYLQVATPLSGSTPYINTLGTLIYTGNGCENFSALEPFNLYFVSEYLDAPVLLDSALRRSWHDFTLQFDSQGFFTFIVDDQLTTVSNKAIDLSVLGLSKFLISTNNSWYGESTYLSAVKLSVENHSMPAKLDVLSNYFPSIYGIHPKNIAIKAPAQLTDSLQYLFVKDGEFQEVIDLELSSGGHFRAYIKNISPGQKHQLLVRLCHSDICGPFESVLLQTRNFTQHFYTSITASIVQQNYGVKVGFENSHIDNVDSYTIYREIVGDDVGKRVFAQITADEFLGHMLNSTEEFYLADTVQPNQTAEYSIESCNPIRCEVSNRSIQITMPNDADSDGVPDPYDQFPNDPNEYTDSDSDGIGNNADEDDDNDGIPDIIELAAGLDPFDSTDYRDDIDGDGFRNIFEYLSGSDLSDPSITPKNFGIYSSFEQVHERFINIGDSFERIDYSPDDNYSIRARVPETEEVIAFTITGKLVNGKMLLSYTPSEDMLIFITINGVPIDISGKTSSYPYQLYWDILAIDVETSQEPVTLELGIKNQSNKFPIYPFIDNLFIPMTNAKLLGQRVVADYDGDGKTDVTVRRGEWGINYVLNSADAEIQRVEFGSQEEDIQVEGDFDGDGIADFAVRRPSKGIWYVQNSSGSDYGSAREDGIQRVEFGSREDDIPVPADYDGDGITDFAVRRASNNMWYIKNSSDSNYNSSNEDGIQRVKFGLQETDIPLPADYDGDGIADIAFRRPSNATWYILESSSGEIQRVKFGLQETDIPVPADYDGDGKADVAFRRPSNKTWYVLRSSDDVIVRIKFGLNVEDIPVVGDYDGDGKADIAVRRESNSMWYILQSSDGEIGRVNFGKSDGMVPVLAPIWEKLSMLGWQQNFVEATLAGKNTANIADDEEMIFFEKSEFYSHEELVEVERIKHEPLH